MDIRRAKLIKSAVGESLDSLLSNAISAYSAGDSNKSKRYVEMAFDLVKKNKVRFSKSQKNMFCRKCFNLWLPGTNAVYSFDQKNNCIRVRCSCGYSRRI